jgi:non-haem Fe2+, alpha-ketoglutarate-dependent halogenase
MKRNKTLIRLKMVISYLLVKMPFIQSLLSKKILDKLPLGWTDKMFWQAFKSGGASIYVDLPCQLKHPDNYQPQAKVAEQYQLTEAQIKSFYENGYIGPFTIMSPEEAKALREHLTKMLGTESSVYPYSEGAFVIEAQDRDNSKNDIRSNYDTSLIAMNNRDRHIDDPQLLSLFQHPALTERCAQLLGENLLLWRTQFFPKAPGEEGTPLHQASTYVLDNLKEPVVYPPNREELFQVTCWIALTKATKENGCMTVVEGTQEQIHPLKISEVYSTSQSEDRSKRFGTAKIEVDYPIDQNQVKPIEMEAGQFFIFSERALHGSLPNTTSEWRWAVNGRLVRPDTRLYTEKMLTEGHSYKVVGVSEISLDNWRAVLLRGEDRFGHNRLLETSTLNQSQRPRSKDTGRDPL